MQESVCFNRVVFCLVLVCGLVGQWSFGEVSDGADVNYINSKIGVPPDYVVMESPDVTRMKMMWFPEGGGQLGLGVGEVFYRPDSSQDFSLVSKRGADSLCPGDGPVVFDDELLQLYSVAYSYGEVERLGAMRVERIGASLVGLDLDSRGCSQIGEIAVPSKYEGVHALAIRGDSILAACYTRDGGEEILYFSKGQIAGNPAPLPPLRLASGIEKDNVVRFHPTKDLLLFRMRSLEPEYHDYGQIVTACSVSPTPQWSFVCGCGPDEYIIDFDICPDGQEMALLTRQVSLPERPGSWKLYRKNLEEEGSGLRLVKTCENAWFSDRVIYGPEKRLLVLGCIRQFFPYIDANLTQDYERLSVGFVDPSATD